MFKPFLCGGKSYKKSNAIASMFAFYPLSGGIVAKTMQLKAPKGSLGDNHCKSDHNRGIEDAQHDVETKKLKP